ncbi:MAG: hypothetical protein DMG08_27240 [Acidobacteria bacterium]|nr:MAG: hypothetical protein DMG08_27240 [Acidobacteriota bacterium]
MWRLFAVVRGAGFFTATAQSAKRQSQAREEFKLLLNTLRDGTTEVVPSRTHRSPKAYFHIA